MKIHSIKTRFFTAALVTFSSFCLATETIPQNMQQIMNQPKYEHAIWGIYAKDLETGQVLFDLNANKLFSPASTTKLLTIAALLHAFGDDYRFTTPVYSTRPIKDGKLDGDLVLIAQGDLTMGGRQPNPNTLSFTKLDHTIANEVPGVILTKEDPLFGINDLAKQIYQKGLRELNGNVIIDDSLFETTVKRDTPISPIMINENLIDLVINPGSFGEKASVNWRPQVPGYEIENLVKTVAADGKLDLEISSDESGRKMIIKGTIPLNQKDIIRTFTIKDPKHFARMALIQALQNTGIKVNHANDAANTQLPFKPVQDLQVAQWVSPPLSEYAKLILKVSHNLGANLTPLLLASQQGKRTFDEGMHLIGTFATQEVKLSPDTFVLIDGAGGNENRLTLRAEVSVLDYMYKQPKHSFKSYMDALPILGVDGSLEDFAKNTSGANKVYAKPGTGVAFNPATGKFFLITQALAGYIQGKNGHLFAYEVVVNNGALPTIDDIFAIFEDEGQLSSMIYDRTDSQVP